MCFACSSEQPHYPLPGSPTAELQKSRKAEQEAVAVKPGPGLVVRNQPRPNASRMARMARTALRPRPIRAGNHISVCVLELQLELFHVRWRSHHQVHIMCGFRWCRQVHQHHCLPSVWRSITGLGHHAGGHHYDMKVKQSPCKWLRRLFCQFRPEAIARQGETRRWQ